MTGRHRKPRRSPISYATKKPGFTGTLIAAAAIAFLSAASSPPAQAEPDVHIRSVADQTQPTGNFLSAVAAAGIKVAGREAALETVAMAGAASHTTDADLEQSLRALFPDIDDIHAEKFVYEVRKTWPGDHDVDTDDDGR